MAALEQKGNQWQIHYSITIYTIYNVYTIKLFHESQKNRREQHLPPLYNSIIF